MNRGGDRRFISELLVYAPIVICNFNFCSSDLIIIIIIIILIIIILIIIIIIIIIIINK